MMNKISLAFHKMGQSIRVVGTAENPLFVASDVCSILEIKNPSDTLAKVIKEKHKGIDTIYTLGGPQKVLCVNESGLYTLIFKSRKPSAIVFQEWVTEEILPEIRKTGRYSIAEKESIAWQVERELCKSDHKMLCQMVKLSREAYGKKVSHYHYSNEVRMINAAVSGKFASLPRDNQGLATLRKLRELMLEDHRLLFIQAPYNDRKIGVFRLSEQLTAPLVGPAVLVKSIKDIPLTPKPKAKAKRKKKIVEDPNQKIFDI
jgi:prophage antirepressor-like protein